MEIISRASDESDRMDFLIAKERERGKELERKLRELKTQGTDLTFGLNELRELQKQAH